MIKITDSKAESYLFYRNLRSTVLNRSKYRKTYLLPFKYSYSRYKKEKNQHVFNVYTQVGVKQLTDFLRTVTAASDLVDCTLVNCESMSVNCCLNVLVCLFALLLYIHGQQLKSCLDSQSSKSLFLHRLNLTKYV